MASNHENENCHNRADITPSSLREAGNSYIRAGDPTAAIDSYLRALAMLSKEPATASNLQESAQCWGNVSAARLKLGDGRGALEAAMKSADADVGYAKAYFRRAKALLHLGYPREAANSTRSLYWLTERVEPDVRQLLAEVAKALEESTGSAPSAKVVAENAALRRSRNEIASGLEIPEVVIEVANFCDGRMLAQLARSNSSLCLQTATDRQFEERAEALCPRGSARWLRRDLLSSCIGAKSADHWGWLYAFQAMVAKSSPHRSSRLAVCGSDGRVYICDAALGGADVFTVSVPQRCVPFSLCWGPKGRYVAFVAMQSTGITPALVVTECPECAGAASAPIITPLRPRLTPYFLAPSPCGSRIALLGPLDNKQCLFIADVAQVLHPCRERALPVSLLPLGTAAPLYLDWAPHAPDLVLWSRQKHVIRLRADVAGEREIVNEEVSQPVFSQSADLHCSYSSCAVLQTPTQVRAPQWLDSPDCEEGRWLVPLPGPEGRACLALVKPVAVGETLPKVTQEDVVCENLPPDHSQFAASRTGHWIAWTGSFDAMGHGGVFVRKVPPAANKPLRIFGYSVEALIWGGDRLALLVLRPQREDFVWVVWDPPTPDDHLGCGCLTVAKDSFYPHISFRTRIQPFFDQFERTLNFWNPTNDMLVYTDEESNVWVQSFPVGDDAFRESEGYDPLGHPLVDLIGAVDYTRVAPPPVRIREGEFACWSPS